MIITRRTFIKTAIGSASVATGYSFFFPKPANSYSTDYLLSRDAKADRIFGNFLQANITRNPSPTLVAGIGVDIGSAIQSAQKEFTQRDFTENRTPFAQRLGNPNNPLWGQQKRETLGPNPGFGTLQVKNDEITPITFTGSTTAGIDRGIQILGKDENLSPTQLDDALIPVREQFEDWGSWEGDIDPKTGQNLGNSITSYETRLGEVTRRYEVIKPGKDGYGLITLFIDAGAEFKTNLKIRVDFG